MNDSDDYSAKLQNLSNDELIRLLSEGENSFRENYYDLILQESKRRNLEVDNSCIDEARKKIRSEQNIRLVKFGYALAFLGGIAGLAIGIYILLKKERNEDGKKVFKYEKEIRKHGTRIVIMAVLMMFIGWPLLSFGIEFLITRI